MPDSWGSPSLGRNKRHSPDLRNHLETRPFQAGCPFGHAVRLGRQKSGTEPSDRADAYTLVGTASATTDSAEPQHQLRVLDARGGGTLAEIVQPGDEQRL